MTDDDGTTIRVFLVDDQELVRAGFTMLVDSQPDMRVVGQAGDGGEALEKLRVTGSDVVLMDVRMPRLDGVEATRQLQSWPTAPRVIVLTTFDLDEYAFAAIKAGAAGFLLKNTPPADLLNAIRQVHSGDAVVSPSTTRRLLEHFAGSLPDEERERPDLADLTARELEVFAEVARGLSNTEIAQLFTLSEATVKTHIGRILAKTGLRDRVALVVLGYETGIVKPSS
ncbi:response regulator transcription factor [Kribbella sp. NPDC056861]|uniref:response regulator transcription factor n=1 Tax=Kribbella sp. NPDC056861 TaxID=3154857 RepID=UPI003447E8ED